MTIVDISTDRTFEAAHHLPRLPAEHKCHRVHGHNYRIRVTIRAEIDPFLGMAFDYAMMDAFVDDLIVGVCDHRLLNDVEGLDNPTGENIAIWAMRRLMLTVLPMHSVTVWETPHYAATVYASDMPQASTTSAAQNG